MRYAVLPALIMLALLMGSCGLWPKELRSLAQSITDETQGEATAWLVGGDVVVIDVARSPLFVAPATELEAVATKIAEMALGSSEVALESISVTFHEYGISEDSDQMRQFIFLATGDAPTLLRDRASGVTTAPITQPVI